MAEWHDENSHLNFWSTSPRTSILRDALTELRNPEKTPHLTIALLHKFASHHLEDVSQHTMRRQLDRLRKGLGMEHRAKSSYLLALIRILKEQPHLGDLLTADQEASNLSSRFFKLMADFGSVFANPPEHSATDTPPQTEETPSPEERQISWIPQATREFLDFFPNDMLRHTWHATGKLLSGGDTGIGDRTGYFIGFRWAERGLVAQSVTAIYPPTGDGTIRFRNWLNECESPAPNVALRVSEGVVLSLPSGLYFLGTMGQAALKIIALDVPPASTRDLYSGYVTTLVNRQPFGTRFAMIRSMSLELTGFIPHSDEESRLAGRSTGILPLSGAIKTFGQALNALKRNWILKDSIEPHHLENLISNP